MTRNHGSLVYNSSLALVTKCPLENLAKRHVLIVIFRLIVDGEGASGVQSGNRKGQDTIYTIENYQAAGEQGTFNLCYIEPGVMGDVTETRNTVVFIGSLIMNYIRV